MSPVTIRACTVAEIFSAPNVDALLAEYARESSIADLPAAMPNREVYQAIEDSGAMTLLAAFHGEVLVGFLVLVVSVNPHYSRLIAVTESFFVAAEYRPDGAGLRLLRAAEEVAKEKHAAGMFVSAPIGSRLAKVMPGVGYVETTRAFFRSLA